MIRKCACLVLLCAFACGTKTQLRVASFESSDAQIPPDARQDADRLPTVLSLSCGDVFTLPLRNTPIGVVVEGQEPLRFAWSVLSVPMNSAFQLADASIRAFNFVADLDGEYVFALQVEDALGNKASCGLRVKAECPRLRNGNFEEGVACNECTPNGFDLISGNVDLSPSLGGYGPPSMEGSIHHVDLAGLERGTIRQEVQLLPGVSYTLSIDHKGWLYPPEANGQTFEWTAQLSVLDETQTLVASQVLSSSGSAASSTPWTRSDFSFVARTRRMYVQLQALSTPYFASNSLYVDNLRFNEECVR